MADDHIATDKTSQDTPAVPAVNVSLVESRFLFVDIAALRAKQLRRGARVRLAEPDPGAVGDQPHKPERVAMEEVRQGLVEYDLPDPKAAPPVEKL